MRIGWLALAAASCVACAAPTEEDAASNDAALSTPALTALQKHKAELLTSIWENGTTVLQYGYCENIGDGRGYTSGRAGFCSGTGDAIEVVRCLENSGTNAMSKYLPALTALETASNGTGEDQASTTALDAAGSYCADWTATAAASSAFRACQDTVVSKTYFAPALARAKKWGLTSALTIAELYDAEINHGEGGVDALIAKANADVGLKSAPTTALSRTRESAWLGAFLARRVATLQADPTWRDAVDRVAVYEQMRRAGNFDLSAAIHTTASSKALFPDVAGLASSGYPACAIAASGTVTGDDACTDASPKN